MKLRDCYGSLATDRAKIRVHEREARELGFSDADVRTETLRAEAALVKGGKE